jgi:hypothetical protein
MTTIKIGKKKALEMIHGAVVERGEDWVYPDTGQCRYVYHPEDFDRWEDNELTAEEQQMVAYFGTEGKKPACLVGLALITMNEAFLPWLDLHNEDSVDGIMGSDEGGFSVTIEGVNYHFTANARRILQAAQSSQDVGRTWGEAEERALTLARQS